MRSMFLTVEVLLSDTGEVDHNAVAETVDEALEAHQLDTLLAPVAVGQATVVGYSVVRDGHAPMALHHPAADVIGAVAGRA